MHIIRNIMRWALAASIVLATGSRSFADTVVYNNLGTPGNVYDCCTGLTAAGATSTPGTTYSAFSFTPSTTVDFTQLTMGLSSVSGANAVTVELLGDASGPGSVLDSWNVINLPTFGTCCTLQDLSGNGIALNSGTTYWLAVLPGNSGTWAVWNENTVGAMGAQYLNQGSGFINVGSQTVGAFEVEGSAIVPSAVPEPGSVVLLSTGLLGLAWASRKRFLMTSLVSY